MGMECEAATLGSSLARLRQLLCRRAPPAASPGSHQTRPPRSQWPRTCMPLRGRACCLDCMAGWGSGSGGFVGRHREARVRRICLLKAVGGCDLPPGSGGSALGHLRHGSGMHSMGTSLAAIARGVCWELIGRSLQPASQPGTKPSAPPKPRSLGWRPSETLPWPPISLAAPLKRPQIDQQASPVGCTSRHRRPPLLPPTCSLPCPWSVQAWPWWCRSPPQPSGCWSAL